MRQRGRARVKARLRLSAGRRLRFNQIDPPAATGRMRLQGQRQAGTDHPAANDTDVLAHAGTASDWRAAAISASISSGSFGTLPVSTW